MQLKDPNGRAISVGDKAMMLKVCSVIPAGSIGEVRDIRASVGALGDEPGCRVTRGPEGDPDWTAWCRPEEIAVIV